MIQIIKCNAEHCDLLIELCKKTFLESHGESASKKDVESFISKTYNKDLIFKELECKNIQYHIIYYKNKVAGYSKIELDTSNPAIQQTNLTKLDRFYLLKEFYGQNLGSILFNFNVEIAKKYHQNGIWLVVWIENLRAVKFYTKIGFKKVGIYDFQISSTHSNPNHIMFLQV
jgi:ribosomal protein S18 acetylase RimI-like enzyme